MPPGQEQNHLGTVADSRPRQITSSGETFPAGNVRHSRSHALLLQHHVIPVPTRDGIHRVRRSDMILPPPATRSSHFHLHLSAHRSSQTPDHPREIIGRRIAVTHKQHPYRGTRPTYTPDCQQHQQYQGATPAAQPLHWHTSSPAEGRDIPFPLCLFPHVIASVPRLDCMSRSKMPQTATPDVPCPAAR